MEKYYIVRLYLPGGFFGCWPCFRILFIRSSFEVTHAVQLFALSCTPMLYGEPLPQCCQVRPTSGPGQAKSGEVCSKPACIKTTKQYVSEVQGQYPSRQPPPQERHFWWCTAVCEIRSRLALLRATAASCMGDPGVAAASALHPCAPTQTIVSTKTHMIKKGPVLVIRESLSADGT